MGAQLDVVGFVCPLGRVLIGQVRDPQQQVGQLGIQRLGLGLHTGDFVLFGSDEGAQAFEFSLVTAGLGAADQLGTGVLLGLSGFGGMNAGAALFVQCKDLGGDRRDPATRQSGVKSGGIFTDGADVVHV